MRNLPSLEPYYAKCLAVFLSEDRQWPRQHRIAHAQWQLRCSPGPKHTLFWQHVLKANGAKR